jgi:hypothetical protein
LGTRHRGLLFVQPRSGVGDPPFGIGELGGTPLSEPFGIGLPSLTLLAQAELRLGHGRDPALERLGSCFCCAIRRSRLRRDCRELRALALRVLSRQPRLLFRGRSGRALALDGRTGFGQASLRLLAHLRECPLGAVGGAFTLEGLSATLLVSSLRRGHRFGRWLVGEIPRRRPAARLQRAQELVFWTSASLASSPHGLFTVAWRLQRRQRCHFRGVTTGSNLYSRGG